MSIPPGVCEDEHEEARFVPAACEDAHEVARPGILLSPEIHYCTSRNKISGVVECCCVANKLFVM